MCQPPVRTHTSCSNAQTQTPAPMSVIIIESSDVCIKCEDDPPESGNTVVKTSKQWYLFLTSPMGYSAIGMQNSMHKQSSSTLSFKGELGIQKFYSCHFLDKSQPRFSWRSRPSATTSSPKLI